MDLPLRGIRVIDAAQFGAAPSGAALLADWGAEVIHVEHPIKGDGSRGVQSGGGLGIYKQAGMNYIFELVNRNKKGITVDFAQEKGKEILRKLVGKSDVFLSSLRPYEIEGFGLDYETLSSVNPALVYANLNGFGQKGPDRNGP